MGQFEEYMRRTSNAKGVGCRFVPSCHMSGGICSTFQMAPGSGGPAICKDKGILGALLLSPAICCL